MTPACTSCSALSATAYSGSGVGIWQKKNTTGADLDVPVSISGLAGQDVTLVFTNQAATDAPFPSIVTRSMASQLNQSQVQIAPAGQDAQDGIGDFNRIGWAQKIDQASTSSRSVSSSVIAAGAPMATVYSVGNSRGFYHTDATTRTATLRVQAATSDGTKVNIWVEDSEYAPTKVTAALANQLATTFARTDGIYDMLKAAGGPLWGPHNSPTSFIAGTGQPVDLVVLNFNRDAQPYGMTGYFWSLHNLLKTVDSRSNESLSFYLDSETLYLAGTSGVKAELMVMAHEGMHMNNFYRRQVSMGRQYAYDTWLEEMTAMVSEDADANAIDPTYNPTRDERLPQYLDYGSNGSYNCALKNWTPYAAGCESYSVSGSFGGFMLRQLGIPFYRNLLNQRQASSEADLDSAIKSVNATSSLGEQLQRFAVSAAGVLPASQAPAGFGFPARTEAGLTIQ
ncbi:MAG: M30 family zinc metallopeptidase, partial [Ramlibacter sp.]